MDPDDSELAFLGHDTIELPFVWVPDDYNGPPLGYPWFAAGRMRLQAEQLSDSPDGEPSDTPSGRYNR